MKLRRSVAVVAGSVLLLSACGGEELPSKSEFISKLKQEMSSELSSLESSGIDKAAADYGDAGHELSFHTDSCSHSKTT